MINKKYDYMKKKDLWSSFKFQYCLEYSTEKTESKLYAYVPRYFDKSMEMIIESNGNQKQNNLMALQF